MIKRKLKKYCNEMFLRSSIFALNLKSYKRLKAKKRYRHRDEVGKKIRASKIVISFVKVCTVAILESYYEKIGLITGCNENLAKK